jgi:hypothetical protein
VRPAHEAVADQPDVQTLHLEQPSLITSESRRQRSSRRSRRTNWVSVFGFAVFASFALVAIDR